MLAGPVSEHLISLAPKIVCSSSAELTPLLRAAEAKLLELLQSDEIVSEFHRYLNDAAQGKAVPIEDGKQGEIVLSQGDQFFISIASYDESAGVLHTHPVRGVFHVLQGRPFFIHRFRLPDDWNASDPCPNSKLVALGSQQVGPGGSVLIDGTREVLWFRYEAKVVVAKYIVPIEAVQTWAFDPTGLGLLDAESADSKMDALIHAMDLLRAMQSPSSLDSLATLSEHRAHFVRWAAIKTVASISKSRGLDLLKPALDDPHRLVRSAAERVLERETIKEQ